MSQATTRRSRFETLLEQHADELELAAQEAEDEDVAAVHAVLQAIARDERPPPEAARRVGELMEGQ